MIKIGTALFEACEELEREKNGIVSSALLSEFKKIEALNNEKIKVFSLFIYFFNYYLFF